MECPLVLRVTCAAALVSSLAVAGDGHVRRSLADALANEQAEIAGALLIAWGDSGSSLATFEDKFDLLDEVGLAVWNMPRRGDPTREVVATLRDAAGQEDYLLHLAIASMCWDMFERLEHSEAALRTAPDPDWYAIAAGSVCLNTHPLKGWDAAVDSALSYLENPSLTEGGRAYLNYVCGVLMLQRAVMTTPSPPDLAGLELPERYLRAARERSGRSASVWAGATNQLAYLSRMRGDVVAEKSLLAEVIGREDAPSTQRALAHLDLARRHEESGEWTQAMECYEAMIRGDSTHALRLSFDVREKLRELQDKAVGER